MKTVKLEYIQEFLLVAETLNFSQAAQLLYTSQSALSRHIALLEESVGTQLLRRTTHGAELTATGQKAVPIFAGMMRQYQTLLDVARNEGQISGKLRIGLLYYSAGDAVSEFIPQFRSQYPGVELELKYDQPHVLYQGLVRQTLDLAALPVTFSLNDKLSFHRFQRQRMVAMLREDHPLAEQPSVSLAQLRNAPLVELEEDFYSRTCTRELLSQAGFVPAQALSTSNIESAPSAVRQHNAVHLTGEHCSRQNARGIRYLPVSDRNFYTDIALCRLTENTNPLIPMFLAQLDSFLAAWQRP